MPTRKTGLTLPKPFTTIKGKMHLPFDGIKVHYSETGEVSVCFTLDSDETVFLNSSRCLSRGDTIHFQNLPGFVQVSVS